MTDAKQFMSLREFLLLRDPHDKEHPRSSWSCESPRPEHIVLRYELAKSSWEKYGDEGPPAGTIVQALRQGFGGYGRIKIVGNYEHDDRFLHALPLKQRDEKRPDSFTISRTQWWFDVMEYNSALHDSYVWMRFYGTLDLRILMFLEEMRNKGHST